ncbi:MAG: hypothetical protein NTY33_00685 [Candidatus Moranbacteria bacterium]|nr:hypothetical protein [Candidatus Moranbacteria bacterium]
MFSQGSDEDFEKIKQAAEANLTQKQTTATAATAATAPSVPDTLGATTKAAPENAVTAPEDTQKTATSEADKTPDETADWKTYADEKNQFEFKYPTDAQVVCGGDLYRVSQNFKTWKFRIFSNKAKADLQTWYNAEFSEKERKNCTLTDSVTLKVGSYETKYANPNSGLTACDKAGYFSTGDSKELVIRAEIGEETIENVTKILKTFKFLTK